MIKPPPYKVKCPDCGSVKMIKPVSDVIGVEYLNNVCCKCHVAMEAHEMNGIERLLINVLTNLKR